METPEAGELPTRFVNFECKRSLSCASRLQTSPTAKWQIAKTVPLNTGLSSPTFGTINPVAHIARVAPDRPLRGLGY
jgi:hypothetical protein